MPQMFGQMNPFARWCTLHTETVTFLKLCSSVMQQCLCSHCKGTAPGLDWNWAETTSFSRSRLCNFVLHVRVDICEHNNHKQIELKKNKKTKKKKKITTSCCATTPSALDPGVKPPLSSHETRDRRQVHAVTLDIHVPASCRIWVFTQNLGRHEQIQLNKKHRTSKVFRKIYTYLISQDTKGQSRSVGTK